MERTQLYKGGVAFNAAVIEWMNGEVNSHNVDENAQGGIAPGKQWQAGRHIHGLQTPAHTQREEATGQDSSQIRADKMLR